MMLVKRLFVISVLMGMASCTCDDKQSQLAKKTAKVKTAKVETPKKPKQVIQPKVDASDPLVAKVKSEFDKAGDNCRISIEGNDQMRYVKDGSEFKTLEIPLSCKRFYMHLHYSGKFPASSMGHNVVIAKENDVKDVAMKAMASGIDGHYLPKNDPRSLFQGHLLVGGGASDKKDDYIAIDPSRFVKGETYKFFCSFPGHFNVMQGDIVLK